MNRNYWREILKSCKKSIVFLSLTRVRGPLMNSICSLGDIFSGEINACIMTTQDKITLQ